MQKDGLDCGLRDLDRVLNEYSLLFNLEQVYSPYVSEYGQDIGDLPAELWPDALKYHTVYLGIDLRQALSCLLTDGSRSASLSRVLSSVLSDVNKRVSLSTKLIATKKKEKEEALEAAEDAALAEALALAEAQGQVQAEPDQLSFPIYGNATPIADRIDTFRPSQSYYYVSNFVDDYYVADKNAFFIPTKRKHNINKRDLAWLESGIRNATQSRKNYSFDVVQKLLNIKNEISPFQEFLKSSI